MLFVPSSLTPYINGKKIFLIVGSISINPMLFFTIGSLWLISCIDSIKQNINYTNITMVTLMVVTAFFFLEFHNISMLSMLEVVFISMTFYLNRINKFTVLGVKRRPKLCR